MWNEWKVLAVYFCEEMLHLKQVSSSFHISSVEHIVSRYLGNCYINIFSCLQMIKSNGSSVDQCSSSILFLFSSVYVISVSVFEFLFLTNVTANQFLWNKQKGEIALQGRYSYLPKFVHIVFLGGRSLGQVTVV